MPGNQRFPASTALILLKNDVPSPMPKMQA